jgi:hypothetical protein
MERHTADSALAIRVSDFSHQAVGLMVLADKRASRSAWAEKGQADGSARRRLTHTLTAATRGSRADQR